MFDGPTVRKNGEGEDSSKRLVVLFLKVSYMASVVCQTLFNDRILGNKFVWVFLIESEGSKTTTNI